MNRYLLLILLSSWAHVVPLSCQCETGVAYANHVLSIQRSLMANADVALLKTYSAGTVNECLKDCCTEKYGSCSVASFKNNVTEDNCQHFNCRPVIKCKFLSSNSTDSFSFTSSSSPQVIVPSSHASKNDSLSLTTATLTTNKPRSDASAQSERDHAVTKEAVATYSEEQLALKNDNTTVKPRKGVDDTTVDSTYESTSRSGVKPRKGVSLDGITELFSNSTKSKVKPRKGVGPYQSHSLSSSTLVVEPSVHEVTSTVNNGHSSTSSSATKTYKDIVADDLVSALEKVFEDDDTKDTKPSVTSSIETTSRNIESTSTVSHLSVVPTVIPTSPTQYTTSSDEKTTTSVLQSSLSTSYVASSSVQTPNLQTAFFRHTEVINHTLMPSTSSPTILEHSKLLFQEISVDDGENSEANSSIESENERKYKSSMHLVLSLVFGLLVLFSVLGVVAKRVYDSWMRRHYRRMDFLIDGMYNGYG